MSKVDNTRARSDFKLTATKDESQLYRVNNAQEQKIYIVTANMIQALTYSPVKLSRNSRGELWLDDHTSSLQHSDFDRRRVYEKS